MGVPEEQKQLHSPTGYPYQEALALKDHKDSYGPRKCPNCGSIQSTIYRSIMKDNSEKGMISGDLEVKTLMVSRCLNCGLENPIYFDIKREA